MGVASWISPKATKGRRSAIEGRGLFAVEPIAAGEVVAVKGGHIITRAQLHAHEDVTGNSDIRIAEDLYLAALHADEYEAVMLFLNHSCTPNVGVRGNVVFVAMREIAAGEELTIDYAMIDGDAADRMECRCGTPACRGVITGGDWRRPELQARYGEYFSWYLLERIRRDRGEAARERGV
jgi:SET domain-containing protein